MIEHPNVIPIAVVVAVVIFLLKETLEYFRRERLNSRKLHAIKRLLAAECERNSFAIQNTTHQVRQADEGHDSKWMMTITRMNNGLPRLNVTRTDGAQTGSVVRPVHVDVLQKYLFETAALDAGLFELMEQALDTLIEANHVRDSLLEYVADEPTHLGGFAEYAIPELDEALEAVRALYFKCTNEPLARGRVR